MKIVLFYHSLVSDWNHGNAHFLRGIATELLARGHQVEVYEPADAWSVVNLLADHGPDSIAAFHAAYPTLHSIRYDQLDLPAVLHGANLAIVHEWNEPSLVRAVRECRPPGCTLLFHDTHHRTVTCPDAISREALRGYDGALVYGESLRRLYTERGLVQRAWTWHEAADTAVFYPRPATQIEGDLVWVGNWGDDERASELEEYLIRPVESLGLKAVVYGVRYPDAALRRLDRAGIEYRGWLPNFRVPEIFAKFRVTLHIPRRPYVETLRGIPTIRPFEALACCIPLICSPWHDDEGLFTAGEDYLTAASGNEMILRLQEVLQNPDLARALANHGLTTVRTRHTCARRTDELLAIVNELQPLPIPA